MSNENPSLSGENSISFTPAISRKEDPFSFFKWLIFENKFDEFKSYHQKLFDDGKDNWVFQSKIHQLLACEAIISVELLIWSLYPQLPKDKKIHILKQNYELLNKLYKASTDVIKSEKDRKFFGIIGTLLFKKYKHFINDTLDIPKEDIEYRYVFEDEFLNEIQDLPLYDAKNEGYCLFENKIPGEDLKKILLGYPPIKYIKKPVKVMWDIKAFFFLLLKFEEQNLKINIKSIEKSLKFRNDLKLNDDYYRKYKERLGINKDTTTWGGLYHKEFTNYPFLEKINKLFDNYIDKSSH